MSKTEDSSHGYRLAAIDLDGTLLGPDHTISPANTAAVARLQAAGLEVVLASGRHHETMRDFGRALPGVRWLVSVQGAEVSDVARTRVLHQSFLDPLAKERVLELGRRLNFPALVYSPAGIVTASDAAVEAYATLIGHRPQRVSAAAFADQPAFKIVWVGEPDRLATLASEPSVAAMPTEKLRSHRHLFEFVQPGVTKATGLAHLAAELGLRADQAAVFGDADNDVSMFQWARTAVAMPHAWPAARASATHVVSDGPAATAFARGVVAILAPAR